MKITVMKNLTKRYLLALIIIALLSITAYLNLIHLIKTQEMMAATINISGRQRMLSQRISLLSLQLVSAKNIEERKERRQDIKKLILLMQESHAKLLWDIKNTNLSEAATLELQKLYHSTPYYLDLKIKKFISNTEALLNASDDKLTLNNPNLIYILGTAGDNLLSAFDKAVSIYQRENEAHIVKLKRLEFTILILTLVTLLMIAFFIFRPMIRLIYRETKQLSDDNSKLLQLSSYDGLTGLANRRYFDQYSVEVWQKGILDATWLSMIMVDIDNFKNYNDTYGHQQGDGCIVEVASALNHSLLRNCDLVARYGGEEFVIILPDTDLQKATIIAEKLRVAIEQLAIPHATSTVSNYVTISLGVAATIPSSATSTDYLLKRADVALYAAKRQGRNRVKIS